MTLCAALLLVSCTPGGGPVVGPDRSGSTADCGPTQDQAATGAPSSLGLTAGMGSSSPAWSGEVGAGSHLPAASSGRLFTMAPVGCLAALDARSGAGLWSRAVPSPSHLMGVTASPAVVVAALGDTRGHAPAMAYSATDRLVGFDPGTGAQRWSLTLADDGQGVPARIAGSVVVVAEADGSVLGIDATDGRQRWLDPAPSGCVVRQQDGLDPGAAVLPGAPAVTVRYRCTIQDRITRLHATTGSVAWTRVLPRGGRADYQAPAGTASGVIGIVVSGRRPFDVTTVAHQPPGAQQYETRTLLALAADTGRPLWQLHGVPLAAGAYGGAGQLCVASGYGTGCYAARTGQLSWEASPAVAPADGLGSDGDGIASAGGTLYAIVPTAAAEGIPRGSTTYRSDPGTFRLRATDMRTGRVLSDIGLPAFYGGPNGVVVSPDTPPGVVAVTGSVVLVSPELSETSVIEAFALP